MIEGRPCALVADDEPAIRRFLRTSLSVHGYAVLDTVGGREALSVMAAIRPDLSLPGRAHS